MSERQDSERLHHRMAAPKAPPKVLKYDPIDMEIRGDEAPGSFGDSHRKALAKQSRESSEPQALVFRHLEERVDPDKGVVTVPVKSYHDEEKVSLARAGETVLETFYGMFYACDDETKEWKLTVDGFIPLCFIQERGNANKPFKIIAVSGSIRLMEFSVTKDTKCAQNKAFVKWNEGISNMFGVRFAKESQANQFYSALSRMKSTLIKTAELFKQPERKAIVSQISDPKTAGVPHSKTSLIVKLPNKETTVMSVPGLLTMSELFDLICKKESLNPQEHQLSLPRIGNKELTYESGTVLGSLKIREVSIIYVGVATDNGEAGGGTSSVKVESLLEDENEKGKQLDIILPNGQQRSLLVPINMPVRNLESYVCKKENLNPRHHSLQSNDFKHQCFDAGCAVGQIEFSELRLLDKKDSSHESLEVEERKDSKTSSNSDELASIGETSSGSKAADSSKSSHGVRPPVPPQPYAARHNQPNKPIDRLQLNELKSSHSFSEYGEKRNNAAAREPSLREAGKPKRKAPRPPRPPQPSSRTIQKDTVQNQPPPHPATEKAASAEGPSSTTPQGSPNVSLHQRNVKKRPAPARPPAPKPSSRQRSYSNPAADDHSEGNKHHDRPPPIFCPPPPPDDSPPPLDECEHPVSPLSDDELQETTWASSFESPEANGYPEEVRSSRQGHHSPSIKTEVRKPPVAAARREKPERPVAPLRQSSIPSSPTTPSTPDHQAMSPEPIPLKFLIPTPEKRPESSASELEEQDDDFSRINFDGDSRSSSVDISSFPESDMPILSPIEGYKPLPVDPPMEFAQEDALESVADTKFVELSPPEPTLPPPVGFSKSESVELTPNLSMSNDSGNVEYSGTESDVTIEDMVVPPPPLLSEDLSQNEKPDSLSQIDVINSIPPPMDFASPPKEFANPPAEFADDEPSSPKPLKKKLGLNSSSFPWLEEPQPSFNAEIRSTEPDVPQVEARKSPVHPASIDVSRNSDERTTLETTVITRDAKKSSPDLSRGKGMEHESSPRTAEIPEPFIQESEQKPALESEPASTTILKDNSNKKGLPEKVDEAYKTPFDDLEDRSTEEPDEGFDDLPDPVLESLANKDIESSSTDSKNVSQVKSDYRLDLSESPDLSPPTPPLTSPPGSGYVTPTLPSPLVSPRDDKHPEPAQPVVSVPAKTESEKIEKSKNVVSSVDRKSNESPISTSSNSVCNTEPIELPNPPPITVPPLRRYSDLAADISFSKSGLKVDEPAPKEKEKNNSDVSSKDEISQPKQHQAPPGYKRPISGSSWADIKNREKELEEERKLKKNDHPNAREPPPPSLVFRNLNRSGANAIRPKSWVAPSSKSFNPVLPSMYKPPENSKQASGATDTKTSSSGSSGSRDQAKSEVKASKSSGTSARTPESKSTSASDEKTKSPAKKEPVEPAKHRPVVIVPKSPAVDTKADTKDVKVSSSTTKVVMREKSNKPDTKEKRKSVQDMMTMFGASKDSRRNSDDSTPQQSPALRSLEDKVIGRSNKQYGISSLVDTLSSKPGAKSSQTSDSKKESKTIESSEKPSSGTKPKDEGVNPQKVYKIILANDEEAPRSTSGKKEETKREDPKANEPKQRSNSNPRQKYNVLFPTKNESINSTETTKSSSSKQEKKDIPSSSSASSFSHTSTDNATVGAKKDEGKRAEPSVILREKQASKPVDPLKRRSMPVYVVENNDTNPQPQGARNLKILMAPQITDVDVVPRGRVAAMKAAWKKEGN